MARKAWSELSDAYRNRLARNGITRQDFESGISLEKARGHAETPERPERAEANPQKYQKYLLKRNTLVKDIQQLKRDFWSASSKWNPKKSERWIRIDATTGKVRSTNDLKKLHKKIFDTLAEYTSRDEFFRSWDEFFGELDPTDQAAFYYH